MGMITRDEQQRRMALYGHGLKHCSACEGVLPIDRFKPNRRGWMGIRSRCRDCDNAGTRDYQRRTPERQACRQKHWRAANPDRWHAIAKTHRDTHPLEERLRRGRLRAERAGVVAKHITADELIADWERRGIDPARCVYTWEPLQDGWHIDHAVPLSQPNTPGHVVNNLVPCNQRANVAKWRRHWIDYLADRSEAATRSSQG